MALNRYGYPPADWNAAKNEALAVLRKRARRSQIIAYSELAAEITSIQFEANDGSFHFMLGEISEDENAAGRGMLSVLVVHKPPGDMKPGPGFFKLALDLDRDVDDEEKFWVEEFKRVLAAHGAHP